MRREKLRSTQWPTLRYSNPMGRRKAKCLEFFRAKIKAKRDKEREGQPSRDFSGRLKRDETSGRQMTGRIIVQYVGFRTTSLVREYTFVVSEGSSDSLHYTLTIANEAFLSHRARYQDAPEICSLRLHHELDAHANHPPTTHFCVTDAELASYRDARLPKPLGRFQRPPEE